MKNILFLAAILTVAGCTDATMAHFSQFGDEAHIQCFSGGQVVYDGISTGKVAASETGAGVFFKEKASGKFVRLYADCIVKSL